MCCKIIEEDCNEPFGEIPFEKNGGETKWEGQLVWSTDLQIFFGKPLVSVRYLRWFYHSH
jgi:hypothetical protein